jgi:hypothetical protein
MEFLRYTFVGKPKKSFPLDSYEDVEVVDDIPQKVEGTKGEEFRRSKGTADEIRNRIIIQINRLVGFICLASFAFIIVYTFTNPDRKIPDIIQNTFSMTLGYFVSSLITFLERQTRKTQG